MDESITSLITIDDIKHRDLRLIADELGLPTALKFYNSFKGINILVPINALKDFQINWIQSNRAHMHVKEIAMKLGLSERHAQEIISNLREERRQLRLLDENQ